MSLEQAFNALAAKLYPEHRSADDAVTKGIVVHRTTTFARRVSSDEERADRLGDEANNTWDPTGGASYPPPLPRPKYCSVSLSVDRYAGNNYPDFQSGGSSTGSAGLAWSKALGSAQFTAHYDQYLSGYNFGAGQIDNYSHKDDSGSQVPNFYAQIDFSNNAFFRFTTSTGFIRIYWDLETIDSSGSTSLVAKTYEYNTGSPVASPTNSDDISPPLNSYRPADPPDPSGDQSSNESRKTLTIRNVRWTAVASYTPPVDGSANGFPPH